MSISLDSASIALSFSPQTSSPTDNHQQILRFPLGLQDSALLPLEQITEILKINSVDVLPIPETHSCVLGVCNWRGEMLWVVDLEHLVGYAPLLQQVQSEPLIVMVIHWNEQLLGLGVRQVGEIERRDLQKLQPVTPGLFPPQLQPFVLGTLPECSGAVLDIAAIAQCSLWQSQQ
ncbi:MAG: chemotaxis protein CheW [Oscillatoriophycideae cyanobacterium NC_groundwater_1537_Pr4_S-0.65um_50_18]|nr:chemotaxis protein CheW [Oscillatoriophycideae cyanobacterium NC_groundwater_1537_Pr4_S-0.65um_50_18]